MAMKFNIQLTKAQQQLLVAAVLFVGGGGYAYIRYFWLPFSKRINEAKTKIEEVDRKIEKAQSQAARLDRLKKELEMLSQQAADAEKRLPKSKDIPAIIDTLSRLTRRYHVELRSFAPGAPAQKEFFTEIPYALNVSGSYHDIGRFFAAIASEERIFNVRNVSYTPGSVSASGVQLLNVVFTLVSYQYKG
ncbi:MAG: type 4a pilus biogenesis protein PilO [Elusimicrobia bacterium]|nr:type 4a pilus biogenesis protein PilO [Elusimicrobiota bacterium]